MFILLTHAIIGMALDIVVVGAVALSIVFLAFLVWLMLRAGSDPKWADISQGVRKERDKREAGA